MSERADRAEVILQLDRRVDVSVHSLSNPDRLYVDLTNTSFNSGRLDIQMSGAKSFVKDVHWGHPREQVTRVVLDLMRNARSSAVEWTANDQVALVLTPVDGRSSPVLSGQTTGISPTEAGVGNGSRTATARAPLATTSSARPSMPPDSPRGPAPAEISRVPKALEQADAGFEAVPSVLPVPTDAEQGQKPKEVLSSSRPVERASVTIARTSTPPRLDDFLAGNIPSGYVRISDFRQREPGDGTPASVETKAYLAYDQKNLYVVFVCSDDPRQVRGRMSKRDDIGDDDSVTVYLDTFDETQRAYYFSMNPLGIQSDGVYIGGSSDSRFDTLWYSDAKIFDKGYGAAFTIPFKSLRFSNTDAQNWGLALGRAIRRRNEASFWPNITRRQSNFLRQLGRMTGMSSVATTHNVQVIPYTSVTTAKLSDGAPGGYTHDTEPKGGADAKVVLHDSLTLDITAEPDFSQVETDDPQVTVNRRFEVYFPEKRPFFIENINYFETPINLLFTRRIADPQFGTRLTGRLGNWNIGALAIDDRAPGELADPSSPLSGERAVNGVARLQRTFRQDSNVGFLFSDHEVGDTNNRVFSMDTHLRLTPTLYFTGQVAHSMDRSLTSSNTLNNTSGNAIYGDLSYGTRSISSDTNYVDYSSGFTAPLGFIQRVGIRTVNQYLGYLFWPEGSTLLSHGPSANVDFTWDRGGRLLNRDSTLGYRMDFYGPAGFSVNYNDSYEYFGALPLRYHTASGSFYVNSIKALTFYGGFGLGTSPNYSPPEGTAPFVGSAQNASLGFTWRPTTRFRVDESYFFTRLGAPEYLRQLGDTAVINHLARTKVNFQFTKALSIRAILDYYFLAPNSALFASDRYKTFTGDILLTYLLHPGTAVYVGYNSSYENLAIDPEAPKDLRRYGAPDYLTSRQFFVKLSYLFRF